MSKERRRVKRKVFISTVGAKDFTDPIRPHAVFWLKVAVVFLVLYGVFVWDLLYNKPARAVNLQELNSSVTLSDEEVRMNKKYLNGTVGPDSLYREKLKLKD